MKTGRQTGRQRRRKREREAERERERKRVCATDRERQIEGDRERDRREKERESSFILLLNMIRFDISTNLLILISLNYFKFSSINFGHFDFVVLLLQSSVFR